MAWAPLASPPASASPGAAAAPGVASQTLRDAGPVSGEGLCFLR